MSQVIPAYWVNAFTKQPFSGNPAVVIPEADDLSDTLKQQIAREVNCSETAFISKPQTPEADLQLRWFTPTQEVKLCGHATIAAVHTLCETGRFNLHQGGRQILYLDTLSGILSVTVDYTQDKFPWIWLTVPGCTFSPLSTENQDTIQRALGGITLDPGVVDSLNQDVLIEISSLKALHSLVVDDKLLAHLGSLEHWRGFCVYTQETVEPESALHLRFFAPQSGISEDPVTGSVCGPLGLYFQQQHSKAEQFIIEQGDCVHRQGRVHVNLKDPSPRVGGQAVTVFQGEFQL